jgi:two-component sensor histidine kinase
MAGFREHIDDLGLAREVIDRSKPVIIDDAAADERFVHFPETSYIRSVLVMPISTARKLYGLLTIESASTGMYGREEQEKLKPLADAAAIALEKAELYEELRAELEEKKRIEERLEHSLAKKDTLLREIHHRVKNNLAMVVSLINLQSSQVEDETAGEVLEHIRSKIYSISLIHEKLYRSDDLQHIVLSEYVHDLLQTLRSTVVDEGDVAVENRVSGELVVDIERAIPLALIITELFTNSYKYGCCETCRFLVRGSADGGDAELRIEDNGPGFPEGFSMEDGDTLGLMLVQSLAEQLAGSARIGDRQRAEIIIRFPLPGEPAEAAAGSPGGSSGGG